MNIKILRWFFVITMLISVLAVKNEFEINDWITFKKVFNKNYTSEKEELVRKSIFHNNLEKVHQHNKEFHLGNFNYTLGINQFSDMTVKEFSLQFANTELIKELDKFSDNRTRRRKHCETVWQPDYFNWMDEGGVSRVQSQAKCGSCYAFGVVSAIETHYFRSTGILHNLSEQQIIDCSRYTNGCKGGHAANALRYVQLYGLMTENDYPYTGHVGKCKYKKSLTVVHIDGHAIVRNYNEECMKSVIFNEGPIASAISVKLDTFVSYDGGIYNDLDCSRTSLNHMVTIVGYGRKYGQDYWIIKNSWGDSWGMNGYMFMARNRNLCGIAHIAAYPKI